MDSSDSSDDEDAEQQEQPLSKHGKSLTKQVAKSVNAGRPLVMSLRIVRA